MWSIIIAVLEQYLIWSNDPFQPLRALAAAPRYMVPGISPPSPNNTFVPSTVPVSPVLPSTVSIVEDKCLVSDFTSTLWFCPSATATATAPTTATTTSAPVFLPSNMAEQPVTAETHASGLPSTDTLDIAVPVVLIAALIFCFWYGYKLGQVKVAQRLLSPAEETSLSCCESIVANTPYDWHDSDSLGSKVNFSNHVLDIALREWHDEKARQAEVKWNDREKAHQIKITELKTRHDDINAGLDKRVKVLEVEVAGRKRALDAKITENKKRESDHRAQIAAQECAHKAEIDIIEQRHAGTVRRYTYVASKHNQYLVAEIHRRKAAERKYDSVQNGLIGMLFNTGLRFGLSKPTAQDAAHDSTTDQLLLAPAAAKSSTAEAAKASPAETASPVATPTPELDPTEPKAEISPQDVAPGNENRLSSPPTSTESLITEVKDASPAATESASEPSATSPSESGVEQQEHAQQEHEQQEHEQFEDALKQQHEHKEEQKEEVGEQEPQGTEVSLQEPSSMGDGAEQSHKEKDVAQDAPVPTEEQATSPRLTEPEAAPDHTTSSDGAFEAPVTTEVLPEERAGDREAEEPMAVEDIVEAPGTTSSSNGASMAPVTNEKKTVRFMDGNGREVRTAEEIDQTPPVSTGHVHNEPADEMDVEEESAASGHPGDSLKSAWEIFTSSQQSSNAITNDFDDESEAEWSNETDGHGAEQSGSAGETYAVINSQDQDARFDGLAAALAGLSIQEPNYDMDIDDDNSTANNTGAGQSYSAAETELDTPMGDASNDNAAIDPGNSSSGGVGSKWLQEPGMDQGGADDATNGTGSQPSGTTAQETAQPSHQAHGNGQGLPFQVNSTPATEMTQFAHQAYGNGQVLGSQFNHTPATEMARFSRQAHGDGQVPPFQKISEDDAAAKASTPAEQNYGTEWNDGREKATQNMPPEESDSELDELPDAEVDKMGEEAVKSGELPAVKPMKQPAVESSSAKSDEQPHEDSEPVQPRTILTPVSRRKTASVAQPPLQAQGVQSTQQVPSQPTPTPRTGTHQLLRTGEEPKLLQKDAPLEELNKINRFAVQASKAAVNWTRTPAEGGPDDASLQQMRNDTNSQLTKIIEDAKLNAEYLENGFQKELQKSPLSAGAQSTARVFALPAVESMREKYCELDKCKNSHHLFMFLLINIDRMLKVLRELVPASPILLPSDIKPVNAAKKIYELVEDAKSKCYGWERSLEDGGIDAASFAKMEADRNSDFSKIIQQMRSAAEYLENGLKESPMTTAAEKKFSMTVLPAVESMSVQYEQLGASKGCPDLFASLLVDIDRMLKVMRGLGAKSTTPQTQPQPPALGTQSTQQVPSQPTSTPQIGTQSSVPLASTAKDWPLDNAKTMNTWTVHANRASREWLSSPEYAGLDGNTFQQARDDPNSQFSRIILDAANWARYLKTDIELRKSPLSAGAQTVFRHAVPAVRKMREQYSVLSQSKGVPHLFVDMLRDIDFILRELSVLVPESPTPPAQSTQQVTSQSTPQTAGTGQQSGNYLYSYGNPLQAAIEIKQRVQEIDQWYLLWEPNTKRDRSGKITSKGTDAEDFAHWDKDYGSRFWAVKRQIRLTANWLENRGQKHPQAEAMLRDQVKPLMKKMRDKTNAIGPMKGCAPLFNDLLGDFVRIVKELNRID